MLVQLRYFEVDNGRIIYTESPFFQKQEKLRGMTKEEFVAKVGFKPTSLDELEGLVVDADAEEEEAPYKTLYGRWPYQVVICSDSEPLSITQKLLPSIVYHIPDFHGDYVWRTTRECYFASAICTMERKEAGDLINSINSGRLTQQAYVIKDYANIPFLLRETHITANADMTLRLPQRPVVMQSYEGYEHYLGDLQMLGFILTDSPAEWMTARIIRSWANWTFKPEHFALTRPRVSLGLDMKKDSLSLQTLVPRLGYERAKKVFEHYPSYAALLEASEKGLQVIPGIGKKLAGDIYTALRGKS